MCLPVEARVEHDPQYAEVRGWLQGGLPDLDWLGRHGASLGEVDEDKFLRGEPGSIRAGPGGRLAVRSLELTGGRCCGAAYCEDIEVIDEPCGRHPHDWVVYRLHELGHEEEE